MNIANQVKSLTEDIEASYGERIMAVSDIVKETHQTLGSFHREHQKMADELRDSLSTSERERMKEFAILIRDVKAAVEAIEKDTAETRAENVKEIKERVSEVRKMLSDFRSDQKEMAHKLAEFLSSSEKGRLEEFATLIGDVRAAVEAIEKDTAETRAENVKEIKERVSEVRKMLSDFRSDQKEMASQLKEFLSKSESQRLSDFKAFFSDVQKRTEEILTATQNDIKEARTHWQNLAKVMAAKRAGKSIPKPSAEMGVPAAVKEEAEEAFEEGELKEKVLKVIQANPGGIKLSKIGKVLKVAYIQVARPIKDLLAEVRITKRGSEYLPS